MNSNPRSVPADAREPDEQQRETQERLKHLSDDPDGPGLQQTDGQVADESTR